MIITRFAPSPTGRLHAGNIRTALVNWLLARSAGGRFVLRLDDTDLARSTAQSAQSIRDDLAWLGLTPDAEVKQSDRFALYQAALDRLAAQGRAYACYETPEELELKRRVALSRGLPPIYDRAALALTEADKARLEAEGRRPHWRFRMDETADVEWQDGVRGPCHFPAGALADPVVRRADGSWLYMLPSVVDDIDMGITDIVRGEDHVTNSAVQLQMFASLGAVPPRLAHMALFTGKDAALSKRLGSEGVESWREQGIEPVAVAALLARLGTSQPVEPVARLADLLPGFALSHFGRAPARFDPADLASLSARCIHHMEHDDVAARLPSSIGAGEWLAIRPNLTRLDEVASWHAVIAGPIEAVIDEPDYIAAARAVLADLPWGDDIWSRLVEALKAATGRKGKALFLPLRLAFTGQAQGPEMAALLPLIGRDEALRRLG
ncbi:MAG: glutamate--tRNA ligase [Alphaproteobacteria bacterium]|nr:glutamate--tRNA ligase [Alphaproteobacteria bacterium]